MVASQSEAMLEIFVSEHDFFDFLISESGLWVSSNPKCVAKQSGTKLNLVAKILAT